MADDDPESAHAERLLDNLAAQVRRAQAERDPLERARILAQVVQPYAGWALRATICDARAAGASWPSIGAALGADFSVIYRQYQGGGPVITARPHHTPGTRNDKHVKPDAR